MVTSGHLDFLTPHETFIYLINKNKRIKNVLEISFEWDNDTVILTDCKWRTESFDPSASFVQQSPARSERRGSHSQEPLKIS